MKVQHKTMLKFKMSYSNLSKSQEIELRDSISDKTSGQRGSVATPICFLESNTCLVCLQETPGLVASLREQTSWRTDKQRIREDALGSEEEGEV